MKEYIEERAVDIVNYIIEENAIARQTAYAKAMKFEKKMREDIMFQLTKLELEDLRSKNSTANLNPKSRTLPHAFTEQGIYIVDDYVNTKTLQLLSQKNSGVEVVLFTENGHGRNGFLTKAVVDDFASQYQPFCIKPNMDCHDRWIIIDYGLEREAVFHCGASEYEKW